MNDLTFLTLIPAAMAGVLFIYVQLVEWWFQFPKYKTVHIGDKRVRLVKRLGWPFWVKDES